MAKEVTKAAAVLPAAASPSSRLELVKGEAPFESKSVVKPTPIIPVSDPDDTFEDESADGPIPGQATTASYVVTAADADPVPAPVKVVARPVEPVVIEVQDKLDLYCRRRKRIMFRLKSGIVMMTVTDVIKSASNIVIILPSDTDGCMFIPSVGENVTLEYDGNAYPCYVPGFVITIDDLGLTFLTLILAEVLGSADDKTQ